MKALSIRQPWAFAIVGGWKPVENRDWPTKFRGRVLIHAGLREDRDSRELVIAQVSAQSHRPRLKVENDYLCRPHGGGARGAIVGEAEVVDCVTAMVSDWFVGPYGFVLRRAVTFNNPIPCKGMLGFFTVPDHVAELVSPI